MSESGPRTRPDNQNEGWPPGIPYIIGNEGCERFSYYGMRAILYVYVVHQLVAHGMAEGIASNEATATVHLFYTGVYALPMIGAIISDRLLGKYNTILWLSLVYCAGHAALALAETSLWPTLVPAAKDDPMLGLYIGLGLIAVGSGGIKPCVSAHVGDQFGKANWFRLERVYQAFYFIINFGSFFSTLLIPWVKIHYGYSVAFGVPGVLMFIATVAFWMGRKVFVHVPAAPGGRLGALDALASTCLFMIIGSLFFTAGKSGVVMGSVAAVFGVAGLVFFFIRQNIEQDDGFLAVTLYSFQQWLRRGGAGTSAATGVVAGTDSPGRGFFDAAREKFGDEAADGPVAVLKIISVFFLVSVFWALFDQHSSSWIRQASQMDLAFDLSGMGLGAFTIEPEQVAALNPLMVMVLIPTLSFGLYPAVEKMGIRFTPLRRMTCGMFVAAFSFVAVAMIQQRLDAGENVHVSWQIVPYVIITIAEVMVSVTGLEFAYSQAPRKMKSTVMGFWLLTVALGNILVALLARFGDLELAAFFWLFAGLMAAAGVLFGIRAAFYQVRDYSQA